MKAKVRYCYIVFLKNNGSTRVFTSVSAMFREICRRDIGISKQTFYNYDIKRRKIYENKVVRIELALMQ
jgi:hypothetical protein